MVSGQIGVKLAIRAAGGGAAGRPARAVGSAVQTSQSTITYLVTVLFIYCGLYLLIPIIDTVVAGSRYRV